jgi:L-seryl-tRNA(Ser) seleniumtransferase
MARQKQHRISGTKRNTSRAETWYDRLHVRPVVNANGTLTTLGGSLMPHSVLAAMAQAATEYVEMEELEEAVGRELARLTRNEAALVTSGASAGIFLAVLACVSGPDEPAVARLTARGVRSLARREVVVPGPEQNPFELAAALTGCRITHVGGRAGPSRAEFDAALHDGTAAVLFFAGGSGKPGSLPLEDVLALAHARSVPVIVDAAGQLPPVSNLWRFTQQGADLAVFSGGKMLRGPGSTGFLVGSAQLVKAARLHASPRLRLGRPMKVSKEELVGLLAAVELFLAHDHSRDTALIERVTKTWTRELSKVAGVTAVRDFPGVAGRPRPRAMVSLAPGFGLTAEQVRAELLLGEPRIDVAIGGERSLYLNAELLRPGEETIVLERLLAVLATQPPEVAVVDPVEWQLKGDR